VIEHLPKRPYWDCAACGRSWPCDPAREHLATELDRTQLAIYAWLQLEDAVRDMPSAAPAELYERFVAWTGDRAQNDH